MVKTPQGQLYGKQQAARAQSSKPADQRWAFTAVWRWCQPIKFVAVRVNYMHVKTTQARAF